MLPTNDIDDNDDNEFDVDIDVDEEEDDVQVSHLAHYMKTMSILITDNLNIVGI